MSMQHAAACLALAAAAPGQSAGSTRTLRPASSGGLHGASSGGVGVATARKSPAESGSKADGSAEPDAFMLDVFAGATCDADAGADSTVADGVCPAARDAASAWAESIGPSFTAGSGAAHVTTAGAGARGTGPRVQVLTAAGSAGKLREAVDRGGDHDSSSAGAGGGGARDGGEGVDADMWRISSRTTSGEKAAMTCADCAAHARETATMCCKFGCESRPPVRAIRYVALPAMDDAPSWPRRACRLAGRLLVRPRGEGLCAGVRPGDAAAVPECVCCRLPGMWPRREAARPPPIDEERGRPAGQRACE
jgi:hypothetical protein